MNDDPPAIERIKDTKMPIENNGVTRSFSDIPDAVIVGGTMPYLSPKELLLGLGSTCKKFALAAKSDPLWKEYCSWRGRKQSLVWNQTERVCQSDSEKVVNCEKLAALRVRFDEFDKAAQEEPNAFVRCKKLLLRGCLSTCRAVNPGCCDCQNTEGLIQDTKLITICADPVCPTVRCLRHHRSGVKKCDWCKLQVCQSCSDSILLFECLFCDKTACLDCQRDFRDSTTVCCRHRRSNRIRIHQRSRRNQCSARRMSAQSLTSRLRNVDDHETQSYHQLTNMLRTFRLMCKDSLPSRGEEE